MTVENKTQIKTYFQTGDVPTEAEFVNLIDSYYDYTDGVSLSSQIMSLSGGSSDLTTLISTNSGGWEAAESLVQSNSANWIWLAGTGTPSVKLDATNTASGNYSVAEGGSTTASGDYSHAEGAGSSATFTSAHAEGSVTTASGNGSHAEGVGTAASGGDGSHAEGYYTIASGLHSHAEGDGSTASGESSHVEGKDSTADGYASHAEGSNTLASGIASHAAGRQAHAIHDYSYIWTDGANGDVMTSLSAQYMVSATNGVVLGQNVDITGNLNVNGNNINGLYTTVQSNSATTWNYQGTDLKALSGNWQNTSTVVQNNSASWSNWSSVSGGYAKLDGTNMPFTNDIQLINTKNLVIKNTSDTGTGTALTHYSDGNTYFSNTEGDIVLRTTGSYTERMRIASNGNLTVDTNTLHVDATNNYVGVGTASPASKLDIVGSANVDQVSIKAHTTQTQNMLQMLDLSGRDMTYFDSAGNLVIDVDRDGTQGIHIGNQLVPGGTDKWASIANRGAVGEYLFINAGRTDANAPSDIVLANDVAGNVGIGTIPYSKLDVNGTVKFNNTVELANDKWIFTTSDATNRIYFQNGGPTYIQGAGVGTQQIFRASDGSTLMTLASTTPTQKNVTIGDSAGNRYLTVYGGLSSTNPVYGGGLIVGNTSYDGRFGNINAMLGGDTGTNDIYLKAQASDLRIGTESAKGINFVTNGWNASRMYINSAGNVGIGTYTPAAKLEIEGSSGSIIEALRIDNTQGGGAGNKITFYQDAPEVGRIANYYDGSKWIMQLGTYGALDAVTLDTNGYVGVGTSSPNQKLTVSGNVSATGTMFASGAYFGDSTNYTKIAADGTLSFAGSATVWEDLRVEPIARTTGTNAPTFEKYQDNGSGSRGVYLYSFSDEAVAGNEKEIHFTIQMPHAWKGTAIYPHVHFMGWATEASVNVVWGLEYTWADIGSSFGTTTMMTASAQANGVTGITGNGHHLTPFTPITPTASQDGISSVLIGRLYRNSSNASDTCTNRVGLLYIDFHYEIDQLGSKEEYTK